MSSSRLETISLSNLRNLFVRVTGAARRESTIQVVRPEEGPSEPLFPGSSDRASGDALLVDVQPRSPALHRENVETLINNVLQSPRGAAVAFTKRHLEPTHLEGF